MRIVITGVGAVSPAGIGVSALWAMVRDGTPCGGPVLRFDVSRNSSKICAALESFDPVAAGLDPAIVSGADRVTQLALVAAREAAADAGLRSSPLDPRRVGVVIGSAIGGVDTMERTFREVALPGEAKPRFVRLRPERLDPRIYGAYLALSVSSEIARDIDAQGPCTTMATGCTAGLDAIGAAADLIQSGLADVVVTGGADAPLTPITFTSFDNIRAITRRNDAPRAASRPFDAGRDGFLLAEGAGILVLERESHARRRGARVHGDLLGYASLSNAYHMTGLPEDGAALAATLRLALGRARVPVEDIDYINAHGSSTPQNDRNETAAFKRAFGPRAYEIPISSTKSVIGHTLGAASALECVVCLLAIRDGVLPPTANCFEPSPECDLDYVPLTPRGRTIRVAECNASGFSGIHSAALLASAAYGEARAR